jgi:hypothetical protein
MNERSRRRPSRLLAAECVVLAVGSCIQSYAPTKKVSVSGEDIVYVRDERTGLCFAVLFLANPAGTAVNEMAMAAVPCENVDRLAPAPGTHP